MLETAMQAYEVLGDSERRKTYDQSSTLHEPVLSEAVELSAENFESLVLQSDALWFIQVYAGARINFSFLSHLAR